MAASRFKGWNSAFLYICFLRLLVTLVLTSYAQASIFEVDPEVQKRKGSILDSLKMSLIQAGKVFIHQSLLPMVLQNGKYNEGQIAEIAVCEGNPFHQEGRLYTFFACPMDGENTGPFAKPFCCKARPAQECCTDDSFGFENDLSHKRMMKTVIIVCSVIGSLILICVVALIICCLCGFIAVCGCCKKISGGRTMGQTRVIGPGMSGGTTIGQYPANQQMTYQNVARPPPQQINYAANQQPAGYQQGYQPANQQPAGYQQSYQPANRQPAGYQQGYQPANQQPPSYQPAYQPAANQPAAPYPVTASQEKSTPYPS